MSPTPVLPPWAPAGVRYAGFWIRVFANVLDGLLLAAVNMALVLGLQNWEPAHLPSGAGSVSSGAAPAAVQVGPIVGAVLIIGFWMVYGATPGKMMCRLRIVDEVSGARPTAWQCIGRYVLGLIALAVGVGYLWIAVDRRKQGWHDKIVRTLVLSGMR